MDQADGASGRTVTLCFCDRRIAAEADGEFVRDPRGWYFPGLPAREMNWRARYYTDLDMTGHPYRFTCCVWCGLDLPGLTPDRPHMSLNGEDGD